MPYGTHEGFQEIVITVRKQVVVASGRSEENDEFECVNLKVNSVNHLHGLETLVNPLQNDRRYSPSLAAYTTARPANLSTSISVRLP